MKQKRMNPKPEQSFNFNFKHNRDDAHRVNRKKKNKVLVAQRSTNEATGLKMRSERRRAQENMKWELWRCIINGEI